MLYTAAPGFTVLFGAVHLVHAASCNKLQVLHKGELFSRLGGCDVICDVQLFLIDWSFNSFPFPTYFNQIKL